MGGIYILYDGRREEKPFENKYPFTSGSGSTVVALISTEPFCWPKQNFSPSKSHASLLFGVPNATHTHTEMSRIKELFFSSESCHLDENSFSPSSYGHQFRGGSISNWSANFPAINIHMGHNSKAVSGDGGGGRKCRLRKRSLHMMGLFVYHVGEVRSCKTFPVFSLPSFMTDWIDSLPRSDVL